MSAPEIIGAVAIGFAAGITGGLLGVGGGILFVPALHLLLDQSQVAAEATSLLAIVGVALVGAWRQQHYGNLHGRDAALLAVLSAAGVGAGVVLANALSGRALELVFAALLLIFAFQLGRRALQG